MRAATWLLDAWVQDFAQVLEMMTAQSCRVAWSTADSMPSDASLWWRQSFSFAPNGSIFLGASTRAWADVGAQALRAAGVELFEQSEARSTFLEIVQQTMSSVAAGIGSKRGSTVDATEGSVVSSEPEGSVARIDLTGEGLEAQMWLVISPELVTALQDPGPTREATPAMAAPVAAEPPFATSKTMEFLLDVELPVSICFGSAAMPLKEVLKLTTGAVVELDRHPDEPVDVIVNNTVIARGEVVVVEGNYGVRISQIINRQQRLALRNGERAAAASR